MKSPAVPAKAWIKKDSYIEGKGSGDAPFFFTQNFFEKNIFFSRKPLDKIEKVWYNIYTEKESTKPPDKIKIKEKTNETHK